nr:MAG TPA: hypothetical protein [Caudoviricetes sp.]
MLFCKTPTRETLLNTLKIQKNIFTEYEIFLHKYNPLIMKNIGAKIR